MKSIPDPQYISRNDALVEWNCAQVPDLQAMIEEAEMAAAVRDSHSDGRYGGPLTLMPLGKDP